MASANNNFKSSEEYRRQKELEEARKAGLAPAEVDEEGNEINPHIPQYMTNAPWYLQQDKPGLKHQKNWREGQQDDRTWYERGVKVFQAKKWRKGACENCGAMTHKTKDCLERPRAVKAKHTNKFIAADEKIHEIMMESFEGKRDRWNGYDAKDYARVIDRYEALEKARMEVRRKEEIEDRYAGDGTATATATTSAKVAENGATLADEDKIDDAEDAGFAEVKKRVRTTAGGATGSVRNLRLREDTAKYLLNLDLNSAHYDPKSRSMREDPNPEKPAHEKFFAGDNFNRKTGDYSAWQSLTVHAFQAHDKGQGMHMQAAPSQAELLYQQFKDKKEKLQLKDTAAVMERYGNAASAEKPDDEELLGTSERYVEYDRRGRVIKGKEVQAKSRYEEDVMINNHTSVFGSWFHDGHWGYTCCHQTTKNSYCTGEAGRAAAQQTQDAMEANMAAKAQRDDDEELRKKREESALNDYKGIQDQIWGTEVTGDLNLDPKKLEEAIKKQQEIESEQVEVDERKRRYNSTAADDGGGVTAEEMEAWRLKRARVDDPLLAFKDKSKRGADYDFV